MTAINCVSLKMCVEIDGGGGDGGGSDEDESRTM